MTMLARYTVKCPECNEYIITGRSIIRRLYKYGTVWVHELCYIKYWDETQNQMTLDDRLQNEADAINDDIWLEKRGLI